MTPSPILAIPQSIDATEQSRLSILKELFRYMDLIDLLVWRDYKVRYKQTLAGITWAFIQPLLTMVVLTFFFSSWVKTPGNQIPYSIFTFSALILWTYFVNVLTQCTNSIWVNHAVITRIYFPRLIIPISIIFTAMIDLAITLGLTFLMILYHSIPFTLHILTLPVFLFFLVITAMGPGLILAALNVQYRDISYTLPFLTQIWFFASPIAYPSSMIPDSWAWLYGLNPVTGVIEGFRWCLLGTPLSYFILIPSILSSSFFLWLGLHIFVKKEDFFGEIV